MYLLGNGRIVTRDKSLPYIENGAVAVDGERIVRIGEWEKLSDEFTNADFIDAHSGVIMPGLINAHTHLYKSLLRGSSTPGFKPSSTYEMIMGQSWAVDRALGFFDVVDAAYAGVIECIKNGVTTFFDHHASYGGVSGTLLAIAGVVEESGLRGCLSYDTSNRSGYVPCSEAIAENAEFIGFCESYAHPRIKAMFGLNAPFTLDDLTIEECVRRNNGRTGFHMLVSEGMDDRYVCMHNYGKTPIGRLNGLGVVNDRAILAHCVKVTSEELEILKETGAFVVNCPQENMSDAAGISPVLDMLEKGINVCIGTAGFNYDMLENARALVLSQRCALEKPYVGISEAAHMLFENNRRLAEKYFEKDIGIIKEGAPADIIIMDYEPYTGFAPDTLDAHIVMGMNGGMCRTTMAAGRILMRDREIKSLKKEELYENIRASADRLWTSIGRNERSWWPAFSIFDSNQK